MTWRLTFYNERQGILAPYTVEAPLPPAAVLAGWAALRAEHPVPRKRRLSGLLERAERASGHDAGGWVLYRIATDIPAA